MGSRANSRVAFSVTFSVVVLVLWGLTTHHTSLAGTFQSPLESGVFQSPLIDLTFYSPLADPTSYYPLPPLGSRFPQDTSELYLPTYDVTPLPLASSPTTSTLELQAYLPMVMRNYPPQLTYGPKALAGADSWDLFGDNYDAYYDWSINPDIDDERFVRMVWCVSDHHLYGDYGGPNPSYEQQIIAAAQADNGSVIGRVWLIFNEPANKWGIPTEDAQCGAFPFVGDPTDESNTNPVVADDPVEAAIRYSMIYDWIKDNDPNARVFAGGLLETYSQSTRNWWTLFVSTLEARGELDRIEGVHIHSYPVWSTGQGCESHYCMPEMAQQLNFWYNNYHVGLDLLDEEEHPIPIWITETGAGPFCSNWERWDQQGWLTVRDNIMEPMSWWFTDDAQWPHTSVSTNPGYDAIYWFIPWWGTEAGYTWWCNFLEDGRGSPSALTPLGEYWLAFNPSP